MSSLLLDLEVVTGGENMIEKDKRSLEQVVAAENARLQPQRQEIETIRQKVEEKAKVVAAIYHEEIKQLKPEAKDKIDRVILPWWQEFKGSILWQHMVDVLKDKFSPSFELSDSIPYFFPREVLTGSSSSRKEKPFQSVATHIRNRASKEGTSVDEAIERQVADWKGDYWTARFHLHGFGNVWQRFYIQPWSQRRASFAFAVGSQWLRIEIDPPEEKEGDLVDRIHPNVYLGFAQHIEDGRVWKLINKGFKENILKTF